MNTFHSKTDRLDLNLLKVFEAAWRERHLGRAAHSLHLTPSAVSHALRRLREHLGDPLFVRDGRRMLPTPACQRLAPPLLESLSQLREALQNLERFEPAHSRQTFLLGMPYAIEAMLRVRDRYQALQASDASSSGSRLEQAVKDGGLTAREREVLELLLLGRSHGDIAQVLGISERTSKFHQGNLLAKLGAESRLDLMRLLR